MKAILKKAYSYGKQCLSRHTVIAAGEAPEGGVQVLKNKKEKRYISKALFSKEQLPTNFSITLGVAPCNHSCIFCPQSIKKPKKAGWMDLNLLEKILHEMPEENMNLNISSYSETLAAPNLVPAIELMKKIRPNLPVILASNGSLFKEDKITQLMEVGLDTYSYSFDAPTKESYNRLMQIDHFERAWSNLEKIIKIKKKLGAKTRVITHIMGFKELVEDYNSFKEFWMKKGIDGVSLRAVGNWGGDTWSLNNQFKKHGFTPIHQAPAKRYPCTSIFMHFKVQWNGFYGPCVCAVPDHVPEEEKHKMQYLGHASEITFTEAWHNLREMRKDHLKGQWDKHEGCKSCNVWSLFPNTWEKNNTLLNTEKFTMKDIEFIDKH